MDKAKAWQAAAIILAVFFSVFLASYLGAAFYEWKINPGEWEKKTRETTVAISVGTSMMLAFVSLVHFFDETPDMQEENVIVATETTERTIRYPLDVNIRHGIGANHKRI